MNIKKCNLLENAANLSIGIIEDTCTNSCGLVKYKITYRDSQGREFTAWTNWMRDDGYKVGDSIPVKNLSIPSFGLFNIPLAVNNHPQRFIKPYFAAIVLAGVGALIAGYNIGKNSKN